MSDAADSLSEMVIGETSVSSNTPAGGATSIPTQDQQESTQLKGNSPYTGTVLQGSPADNLSQCSPVEKLEKEVNAASKDSNTNNSDVEGLETMQEVEMEGIAVDDESVQRMLGLLAAAQDSANSLASEVGEAALAMVNLMIVIIIIMKYLLSVNL